jgi:hypothetical protein
LIKGLGFLILGWLGVRFAFKMISLMNNLEAPMLSAPQAENLVKVDSNPTLEPYLNKEKLK